MSDKLGRPPVDENIRFWAKVQKGDLDTCWVWIGTKNKQGYGLFKNKHSRTVQAHRFSFEVVNGKIPDGLLVCHKCDNPSCVNPNHLFLGTNKDNTMDMINKGRGRFVGPKGDKNHNTKLSEQDVIDIRNKFSLGISCINLSKEYNISRIHITRIVYRKRRNHV